MPYHGEAFHDNRRCNTRRCACAGYPFLRLGEAIRFKTDCTYTETVLPCVDALTHVADRARNPALCSRHAHPAPPRFVGTSRTLKLHHFICASVAHVHQLLWRLPGRLGHEGKRHLRAHATPLVSNLASMATRRAANRSGIPDASLSIIAMAALRPCSASFLSKFSPPASGCPEVARRHQTGRSPDVTGFSGTVSR